MQNLLQGLGGHGFADQIALRIIAAKLAQEFEASLFLDPFTNDFQTQFMSQGNGRANQRAAE